MVHIFKKGDFLKRICFLIFISAAICLFLLLSCEKADTLFDILSESVVVDENIPAGKILCYGRYYENSVTKDTLEVYFGRDVSEKIEDFAFFSSINGEYAEISLVKLYKVSDTEDIALLFEKRIKDTKKALGESGRKGYAENGKVEIKGNTVALYMLPAESGIKDVIKKKL